MKTFSTLLFLLLSLSGYAQISMARYFDYDLLPRANFTEYKEVPITWNFDGKTQREFNAGLTALKEERYLQAITAFDEAINLTPSLWVSYYYRGICLKITGKLDAALTDLQFAREKSGGRYEISYEIGEIFQRKVERSKAIKYYEEAKDLAPNEVEGYYGLANIAFLNAETDKAVRLYKKCMDVNPNFPDAYLKAGLLRLFVNRRENKAFEYFDKAIEVAPNFQDGLYWRGLINTEFNNIEKALLDWDRLIQLNPQKPLYTMVRGYLHIELNDFEKAFTDLKNSFLALNIDETDFEVGARSTIKNRQIDIQSASHYLMRNIFGLSDEAAAPLKKAYCLLVKYQYPDALTHLNQSLSVEPSASAYLLKATTFEYLQKLDSSLVCLDKTLKIDNDIFEAHKKRAIYRSRIRDWRGATIDFMAMERLQPESTITYKLRGQLKASLNDHYGAIIDLTRYLKSDSFNVEIIKLRANSQYQVQNYRLYLEDYKMLLKIDTSKLEHHQGIYVGSILLKDTVSAIAALTECARILPEEAFPILQQMEVHLWKKEWKEALLNYSQFVKIPFQDEKNRSEAFYLKGLAHLGLSEYDLALDAFEKSIEEGKLGNFVNLDAHYERGKLNLKAGKKKQTKSDFKILKANNYAKDKELIETVLNSD